MAIFDRVQPAAENSINVHVFFSYLHVWLHDSGGLGSTAASRAVTSLTLEGSDVTDAQSMKANFDAMPTDAAKDEYAARIHAAVLLAEAGEINSSEFSLLLAI